MGIITKKFIRVLPQSFDVTKMETRRMKNRNHRNMFLPLQNQMNDYMQMHDQKVREYQNYLNYLHFNIINNSPRNEYHQMYNVPPPTAAMLPFPPMNSPVTPVSLAFSHQSSSPPASTLSPAPSTSSSPIDFRENYQVQNDIFSNKIMEPMRNSFYGEEANVWGPGLLGLFVKSPSQFETSENDSRPSSDFNLDSIRRNKPHSFNFTNGVQSENAISPKSEIPPPGFGYNYSSDVLLREESFKGNRSM